MLRTAAVLACISSAVAVGAPAPPPGEQELIAKVWGRTAGRGEFALAGKQLTMRTLGAPAHGIIYGDGMNMPRTVRTASGDFVAAVRVVDASAPNKNAKHEDAWPGTRAGLFIQGGGYGVELHLYQYVSKINGVPNEEPTRCVWVDTWFPGGGAGRQLKTAEPGKSTYLRVTRKEKVVTVSYSFDGKDWSDPINPRQALDFPDEVTVGVFFAHSTYQALDATFDGLTVEKPKGKK